MALDAIATGFETDVARWDAVRHRDPAADGRFWYSVASTGVYCRPSCAARLARRENVAFHPSPDAAERAGFRACKRCNPAGPSRAELQAKAVAHACRTIERAIDDGDPTPPLAALAAVSGLSRFHFHKVFRGIAGATPRDYAAACRAGRVRAALAREASVTAAIHEAGYGSTSRFYEGADAFLGMTPSRFRAGGARETIGFAVETCSLGRVLVAATARGVCAIFFGDHPDALEAELRRRFPRADLAAGDAGFRALVARVVALVEAPGQAADLPLDVRGTVFQQKVWRALREIPAGQTASYAAIGARIGAPAAVRAVAQACAANSLAVAIPCHRVVRSDGGLSGYRWGVARKRALLAREAS